MGRLAATSDEHFSSLADPEFNVSSLAFFAVVSLTAYKSKHTFYKSWLGGSMSLLCLVVCLSSSVPYQH